MRKFNCVLFACDQVLFYDVAKQKVRKEFKLSNGIKLRSMASK